MRRAFPAAKRTELIPSIYNVRKSRQQDGNREIKFFEKNYKIFLTASPKSANIIKLSPKGDGGQLKKNL